MKMAATIIFESLLGLAFFGSMVSFFIPYKFDHHVTVEFFDIVRMVDAAFQNLPHEEAFSFWVGERHDPTDTKDLQWSKD